MSKLKKFSLAAVILVSSGVYLDRSLTKAIKREDLINDSIIHLNPGPNNNLPISKYVPPEGRIIITPKDPKKKLEDVINIKYDTVGWTFRPGIAAGVLPPLLGLDFKYAFANRLGLNAGLGYRFDYPYKGWSPFAGITYRLDNDWLHNTEAFAGILLLPRNTGLVGIRVNL